MEKSEAIKYLTTNPYLLGHLLGFDKLTKLHNDWILDMLFNPDDETLMAHRGSFKTTCVSIALALLLILRPNLTILFLRKTDTDVKEIIRQVKKILLSEYLKYFVFIIYGIELVLTVDNATEINTNLNTSNKGTSQLTGNGIAVHSGKHYDLIFTDDIVNLKDRLSRAERETTKTYYRELQNIKNKGGRIYNTCTPWHKNDCVTELMPNKVKYDIKKTNLLTEEEIKQLKKDLTNSLFAVNYELKHIASEDVLFTDPLLTSDSSLIEQGTCHIDAAYNGKDYTAFTIVNKKDSKYYVFGKTWRRHVDDCIPDILKYIAKFNAGKIYCENNADKGYLAKDLKNKGQRVVSYHEKQNKYIKITSHLKPVWDKIIFLDSTDEDYINMITDFNDNAEHDDCPDSLSSLIRVLLNKNTEENENYTPLWN